MNKIRKLSAYAYLRVSGQGQMSGNGFHRQLNEIIRFGQTTGYKIIKIYKEQVSGTSDEDSRPEMSKMIADLLSNGCNTVIVEDLTRLAREYRIQENIMIYLASKNINLIAANTGENITEALASDPMRKALVQVQGIFGELDKSLLVRKLRSAREKIRSETGRCEGPKPYGSLQGEADVVRLIMKLRRKSKNSGKRRETYQAIADRLNEEGFKPRRGEKWTSSLVFNVIKTRKRR